jgi:23S rRNA (pseudouridine1915-N3)-methyltransferase
MKAAEAERITAAIPKDAICVALDERGQDLTTQAFSDWLTRLKEDSRHIVFIIGGPDGLDEELKRRCTKLIRLSSMTLPHGMARVLLAEQLYRAWSLANNHPYHRA